MRYEIFGIARIIGSAGEVELTTPMSIDVFKILLLMHDRVVETDWLAPEMWPSGDYPKTMLPTLQTYISIIRGAIAKAEPGRDARQILSWYNTGYYFRLSEGDTTDFEDFRSLIRSIRSDRKKGDWESVRKGVKRIPEVRGTGLAKGRSRGNYLNRHQESFDAAIDEGKEYAMEALIELGEYWEAISVSREAIAENPLREKPYQFLMRGYAKVGDRERALSVFKEAERMAREGLGVLPSPELATLRRKIITGSPV